MIKSGSRALLLLYALLNAAAYSCLLPLWEGFDEAYHYGYVQILSTKTTFPVLDQATLSREIWHSFELAPVSHYLQPSTGAPVSFSDYFSLAPEERVRRRQQLEAIPPHEKWEAQPDKQNYEVNQSPLPYLLMAPVDWALASFPLITRVLWIRLLCSGAAVLLLAHAMRLLARQLSLPEYFANAAMFCVFSSQMLFATLCHICNDWLAVPMLAYLLWAAIRVYERGSRRDCVLLGVSLSIALLTKAYFLILAPLAFGIVALSVWRKRASVADAALFTALAAILSGPWYWRNALLYRNVTGTVASTSGISAKRLLDAAMELPWRKSIVYMAHSSLWTGNNSFTTFSSATLNVALLLIAVSVIFCFIRARAPERILASGIALFSLGLAYISITFYAATGGKAFAAVPWYMQGLLAPVLLLCFLGMSRVRILGGLLARAMILLSGYVLAATYLVKLVPMYSGHAASRGRLLDLWNWYLHEGQQRDAILSTVCLIQPAILWALIGSAIVLDFTLSAWFLQRRKEI